MANASIPENRLLLPHDYAVQYPVQKSLVAPVSGVYDGKLYYFACNSEWRKIITGWMSWLTDETYWIGADSEKSHGQEQISTFLECVQVIENIRWNNCILEQEIDGIWIPVAGYTDCFADSADILNLQNQIDGNDADILNLQNQIDGNDADILNLQTQIDGNDADILNLQAQINSNDVDIADHETRITTLENASGSGGSGGAWTLISSQTLDIDGQFTPIDTSQYSAIKILFAIAVGSGGGSYMNIIVNSDETAINYTSTLAVNTPAIAENSYLAPSLFTTGVIECQDTRSDIHYKEFISRYLHPYQGNNYSIIRNYNMLYRSSLPIDDIQLKNSGAGFRAGSHIKILGIVDENAPPTSGSTVVAELNFDDLNEMTWESITDGSWGYPAFEYNALNGNPDGCMRAHQAEASINATAHVTLPYNNLNVVGVALDLSFSSDEYLLDMVRSYVYSITLLDSSNVTIATILTGNGGDEGLDMWHVLNTGAIDYNNVAKVAIGMTMTSTYTGGGANQYETMQLVADNIKVTYIQP